MQMVWCGMQASSHLYGSAYTAHIFLTQRNQTTTCCDMRTVFKKATRNSCPPKTREANQPIPRRKIFYGLGMVIQELIDFPLRRNQKSKVEAGDTEDLVGDEYPTCPTPPKKIHHATRWRTSSVSSLTHYRNHNNCGT